MPGQKSKLGDAAQAQLVRWIDDVLGPVNRGDFVHHFKIKSFQQTTFNRDVGRSGRFTEERARTVCKAIGQAYDDLPHDAANASLQASCDYRCGLFHAINAGICTDINQLEVRKRATWQAEGHYRVVYRYVSGHDRSYEVQFKRCPCGATLFEYVKDEDPLPLCSLGFALCVGEMLNIYMIGDGVLWTLACHLHGHLHKRPLTGILLHPNPQVSQVQANKFVLIKLGSPIAAAMTDNEIALLLNNASDATNGTLVAARE